jgi:hypothetical protein
VDYLGVAFAMKVFIKEWGYSFTNYGPESENTSFAVIIQLEPEIYCLKGLLLF